MLILIPMHACSQGPASNEKRAEGLTDAPTGERYRQLILANGTQRDITEVVEEFLGRPSNNEAYIKSLGLE